MTRRLIGLAAAGVTTLLAIALIGWVVFSGMSGSTNSTPQIDGLGPAPSIDNFIQGAPAREAESILDEAQDGQLTWMDPDDSERVASIVEYESLEPQPAGRMRVESPRAWMYTVGGMTIHIRADTASWYKPSGSNQPESGLFRGDVEIHVMDGRIEPGAGPLNAEDRLALVTLDAMSFDFVLGELATQSEVSVTAPGIDAKFNGLTAIIDEANNRLASLRTGDGGRVIVTPDEMRERQDRTASSTSGAGDGDASDENAPIEDVYALAMHDDVTVDVDGSLLKADRLEVWARLLDGQLHPEAIASLGGAESQNGDRGTGRGGGADSSSPQTPTTGALTWSGRIEIRRMDTPPDVMSREHLAGRFSSPETGTVLIEDAASGARVQCLHVSHGFSSGSLSIQGRGSAGVIVRLPDLAEGIVSQIDIDLQTGVGAMPGPGAVTAIGAAAGENARLGLLAPPELSWQERCDLVFQVRDGSIDFGAPDVLKEAIFQGDVLGRYEHMTVRSDFVRALLKPSIAHDKPTLSRIVLDGDVKADGGADGRLTATRLDIHFSELGDEALLTPTLATAEGRVRGDREGSTLRAEIAEAVLHRDESGGVGLHSFNADRDVVVTHESGVEAYADALRLDMDERLASLVGAPAQIRMEGGVLSSEVIEFDEETRVLTVPAPGEIQYTDLKQNALGYTGATMRWEHSLRYDDTTGVAEFGGDCVATATASELIRDTARGQRVLVRLTPNLTEERAREGVEDKRAELLGISLFGAFDELTDEEPAEIESRRYVADADTESGLRLSRLVYVQGPSVIIDAASNRIDIPGPGQMLLEDRTDPSEEARRATVSLKGTTLFEWDGGVTMHRASGDIDMRRRVRLRQKPPGAEEVAQLECERLEAKIGGVPSLDGSSEDEPPSLLGVDCSGAVYMALGERQLISDGLTYDRLKGLAEATAAPGNMVMLFEPTQGLPLTGSVLRWDLVRDRIEWFDAGETTFGR